VLNTFIYTNPTWLWGGVVVVFFVTLALIGLVVFQRAVRLEVRLAHNDLAGFTVAIISVTYAVLLAFIAVATWESYSHAQEIVDREADFVGNIYRDSEGLPMEMGREVRTELQEYVRLVVEQEWPAQQRGVTPSAGWQPLHKLHASIATMRPQNTGESVIEAELLRTLNELYSARASRLSAVEGHIPDVVWWIILLGGMITTGYTYLFGFHDFRMHLVMTAAVSATLALVVVLIMALDWPFRGEVSISSDAFTKVEASWSDLQLDQK
jgi:hypothetical protein